MTSQGPRPNRRTALALIGGALAQPRPALAGGVDTVAGRAFGTTWRIAGPAGDGVARLAPQLDTLFAGIDALLSPWRDDSAISRFNAGPAQVAVSDPALIHVAAAALNIARASDGAFDPTVGPLVAQWGFGPITRGGAPDIGALSVAGGRLRKARDDLTLDLCGIAKGWALDQAARLATGAGFDAMLLDLGGEFVALGTHPAGRDWRVAVEAPIPGAAPPAALRLPPGMAVATSGTAAQSYVLGGTRYSHVIDPRRRMPVGGALLSVTVAAADAMTADGWATALLAAGETAGQDLAQAQDIAALFVTATPDGLRTARMRAMAGLLI